MVTQAQVDESWEQVDKMREDFQNRMAELEEAAELLESDFELEGEELDDEVDENLVAADVNGKVTFERYRRASALPGGGMTAVHPTDLYYAYNDRSAGRQSTISVSAGGRYTRTTSLALLFDAVKGFKSNGYNEQEIGTILGTVLTNGQ